jgi:peptidoglycan/xylan/chitin deacetylase (PgdA/CDA1 family)
LLTGYLVGVRALALTFDDGPDCRFTPMLLDLFGEAGATATFFVIAPRAAAQPALIERMLREGHAVGLHCDQHVRHSSRDKAWCARDADRALQTLRELGVEPVLWRTPWGDIAPWTCQIAHARGLRLISWSVDTNDWRGDPADEMFASTRLSLEPGAVVLAHDGIGPGALRDHAEQTVAYAKLVIDHAQRSRISLKALT